MKQFIIFITFVTLVCADVGYYNKNSGQRKSNSNNNNNNINNNNNYNSNSYNPNKDVPILRLENNNDGEGGYNYAYETGDGKSAQEQGYQKNADTSAAQGSYTFTAPDGQQFSVSYTADENGFIPQGAHIPTPPPIPAEILQAIEQNKADEARGIVDDGQYRPEPEPQKQFNAQRNNGQKAYF